MTFRYLLLTLATALSLTTPARAQTLLGQPTLDEGKVTIWCATIRYVYDDGGHPALKSSVRCAGGDLADLAASIRPDSLRVYSVLYAPIEEKGRIYEGKKDNPARLQALVQAIISKLKASPARRRDPARLQRLEALEKALTDYAVSGTPPGDVAAAMQPEAPDTTTATAANLGPAETAEAQAPAATAVNEQQETRNEKQETTPGSAQDLLTRFAAPLALILSILALVIFAVQRVSMARWSRLQRRETLAAKQAATAAQTAASGTQTAVADTAARLQRAEALVRAAGETPAAAAPLPLPDKLTPAQRQEVERLVSQRVDEELKWLRENLPELVAQAVAGNQNETNQ